MPIAYLGTRNEPALKLESSSDLIAVRTRNGTSIARALGDVPTPASSEVADGTLVASYPDAGVEVYRFAVGRGKRSIGSRKAALAASPDVRFAGGVLVDPSGSPVLYTENLFVKFADSTDAEECEETLRKAGLAIRQRADYAPNAYFVSAPEGIGQAVFEIANGLLEREDVEFSHPELIRPRARKAIAPQQWHLRKTDHFGQIVDAHANVELAHAMTDGEGVTIAVIDDGFDIDHPELGGSGKIVAPRDATLLSSDPRPKHPDDIHGTACAGVACGNGLIGASGVAPKARLVPIRLMSGLGSIREAEAFKWAADNGADVISCSWGPQDGAWFKPEDPLHATKVPIPASTRLAIDYVVENGRGGKGCVVLFAAGNGNESVDNDGYASYHKVIAVAACNDRSRRSVYSDYGAAIWCAFPSNDRGHAPYGHPDPLTPGIWTVDRAGTDGYNSGKNGDGDSNGMFTGSFGGTSSACPGAAGVAALVLAANPDLRWHEVKEILKRACDRIDPQGGQYDAGGHSRLYGHGRLNAATAVALAQAKPRNAVRNVRVFDAPLPDLQKRTFTLRVADNASIESAAVSIELRHSHIGDLRISVQPPGATGVGSIMLHDRAGGSRTSIKRVYDVASTPDLARLANKAPTGEWTLTVEDLAADDAGMLVSFGVHLEFAGQNQPATPSPSLPRSVSSPRQESRKLGSPPGRRSATARNRG
jgi:subtilisin family serine protease